MGILEYDGPIHQIRRFLSSLLSPCTYDEGCQWPYSPLQYPIDEPRHLSVIPHIIMRDVDGLTCHYDTPLITHHLMATLPFYLSDRAANLLLMTLSAVYCLLSLC
jgi:hypothetical protein